MKFVLTELKKQQSKPPKKNTRQIVNKVVLVQVQVQ